MVLERSEKFCVTNYFYAILWHFLSEKPALCDFFKALSYYNSESGWVILRENVSLDGTCISSQLWHKLWFNITKLWFLWSWFSQGDRGSGRAHIWRSVVWSHCPLQPISKHPWCLCEWMEILVEQTSATSVWMGVNGRIVSAKGFEWSSRPEKCCVKTSPFTIYSQYEEKVYVLVCGSV